MSTRKYRETLRSQGVSLKGKDIDHIIPRSRGGPDMPWNYNPLDSSINRSLQANGMWWKMMNFPLETMNACQVRVVPAHVLNAVEMAARLLR